MKTWKIFPLIPAMLVLMAGCSRNASEGANPAPITAAASVPQGALAGFLPVKTVSTTGGGNVAGKKALEFSFQDADGKTVNLSDLRGQAVVLNFWASWCPPCKEEMPLIQKTATDATLRDRGLLLFGANLAESTATVQSFMKDNKYNYTVLLDTNHILADAYGVRAIPTTFFIDASGLIQSRREGAFLNDMDLMREIVKILPPKGNG